MQIDELILVTLRAAAHPVQTRDTIRNGDFWHGILSSQECRDTIHKDGHCQKNLFEIKFLTVQELVGILCSLFYVPGTKHHLLPCSNSVDIYGGWWHKGEFCQTV